MPFIEIHVKGRIAPNLSDWFQGLKIQPVSPNEFCLTSEATDNAAVYGIISTLSTFGLTLLSISVNDTSQLHEETSK